MRLLAATFLLVFMPARLDSPSGRRPTEARVISTIVDPALPEVSGCAATRRGVWVHNDSGNPPELFLLNPSNGRVRRRVPLAGATNIDWEDIAFEKGQLLVGDIGDNNATRADVVLYRVPESAPSGPAVGLRVTYPDGAHNAEALVLQGGDAFVITKADDGHAAVYVLRGAATLVAGSYRFERIGGVDITTEGLLFPNRITGADVSPDGRRVVLRTYQFLYLLERGRQQPFDSVWSAIPKPIEVPLLAQAEAVCVSPDGRRAYTTTEKLPAPIVEVRLPAIAP